MTQANENMMQETLFSFLGEEEPTPVKASSSQTSIKPSSKPKAAKSATKPAPKTLEDEKLELNMETIIRYGGETLPITDYFSQEEITQGIRLTEEGKEGEHSPITGEDIRKRMEDEYGELIEGLTTILFNKEKNMVVPVLQARKKGSDNTICYYCGTKIALTEKFSQPICGECNQKEFRVQIQTKLTHRKRFV